MTIGEALKQLRLHAGLTQEQMAAGIVSESFYSKVERDIHDIDTKVLMDILTVHRFNVIEFFGKIWNQPTSKNPDFDLVAQISDAQNKKDLGKLNEIATKIQNGGVKSPSMCKLNWRVPMLGLLIQINMLVRSLKDI